MESYTVTTTVNRYEALVRNAALAEITCRYLEHENTRYIDGDYLRLIYGLTLNPELIDNDGEEE